MEALLMPARWASIAESAVSFCARSMAAKAMQRSVTPKLCLLLADRVHLPVWQRCNMETQLQLLVSFVKLSKLSMVMPR